MGHKLISNSAIKGRSAIGFLFPVEGKQGHCIGRQPGREELVQLVEKFCEIEWTNPDGEDEGAGFFGEEVEEDY